VGSDRRGNSIIAIQLTALITLTGHFIPPHWSTFLRHGTLVVLVGLCGGSSKSIQTMKIATSLCSF